jgi:hypothetical protein
MVEILTWIHNRRVRVVYGPNRGLRVDCECYHRSRNKALWCHWLRRGRNLRLDVQSF